MPASDKDWMDHALRLASRGVGKTATNPSVGCVIVKDGVILGRGRTGPEGRPHAERLALNDAASRWGLERVRGATAYVTLEPCAHTGKTPPCTEALIAKGIGRVVSPLMDPDPRVAGKGFAMLRDAGITVDVGESEAAARRVLRGYLSRAERKRPFLTLKLASTLDGRIATRTGESRWITGPQARARVHLMRAQSDGILIGVGSVLADDPQLDVRLDGMTGSRPARIVADTRLQTPLTGRLAKSATEQPVILLTSEDADPARVDAFEALGATVVPVPMFRSTLSMEQAFGKLAELGIGSLLCEGGGRLAASLLREELVDELAWFTAGAVMGDGGYDSVSDFGVEALVSMPRFTQVSLERMGEDTLSVWQPPQKLR